MKFFLFAKIRRSFWKIQLFSRGYFPTYPYRLSFPFSPSPSLDATSSFAFLPKTTFFRVRLRIFLSSLPLPYQGPIFRFLRIFSPRSKMATHPEIFERLFYDENWDSFERLISIFLDERPGKFFNFLSFIF